MSSYREKLEFWSCPISALFINVGVFDSSEVEIKLDNRPNNIAVQNWFIKNWKFTTFKVS